MSDPGKLETYDTVSLKSDISLIGIVERTFHDFNTHDALDDLLIVAHVIVDEKVLRRFLASGAPERGYVFVSWSEETAGRTLVPEAELNLIERAFTIGDTVKRKAEDAMVGTVINVEESFVLQPLLPYVGSDGTCSPACDHALPPNLQVSNPHKLLYNIPSHEVRRAYDYIEGDHILYKDWFGEVLETSIEVVLHVQNCGTVVPEDPYELELVVHDSGKPLVSLPDSDGFRRPDVVSYKQGLATIAPHRLRRGQVVVTNQRNLRNGRWLQGSYRSDEPATGLVVDARTRVLDMRWLVPNVTSKPKYPELPKPPPIYLKPYDNLSSFREPRDLRLKKGIVLYDRGRRPTVPSPTGAIPPVSDSDDLKIGDQVRFRDPAGAAVKYGNSLTNGVAYKIPAESTATFDLNEYFVVLCQQTITVKWQDSTTSKDKSIALMPYAGVEYDMIPGDIVATKEDTQQIMPDETVTMFNEIQYLQANHDLRLRKLGVIQAIDAKERLAVVRWFHDARVEVLDQGQVLRPGSSLGPISDTAEEVSLYEIMSFPALLRRRHELVILPGDLEPKDDANRDRLPLIKTVRGGSCTYSFLRPHSLARNLIYLESAYKPILEYVCDMQSPAEVFKPRRGSKQDWVGEVVDVGLDGLITVRLGAFYEGCKDIRIPLNYVLMVIDEDAGHDDDDVVDDPRFDPDDEEDLESELSAIEEVVEYEGGERLDDGQSGDEMWSTDDESPKSPSSGFEGDVEMLDWEDAPQSISPNASSGSDTTTPIRAPASDELSPVLITSRAVTNPPPLFDVLSMDQPPDHFALSKPATSIMPALLRRINKEHKILRSSLPKSIYVRTFEGRLDSLRCMIIGPENTPYEFAPFVFDILLPPTYPNTPPSVHFHSWSYGHGRINPNLYEEGKVCLSLLGTWPGKNKEENWSDNASLLQVLVSMQALVLNKNPYFNEAGFDVFEHQGEYATEAAQYTEKAFVMARGFVKHALSKGVTGLDDVLAWNYLPAPPSPSAVPQHGMPKESEQRPETLRTVISRARKLIDHANTNTASSSTPGLVDATGQSSSEAFLTKLSKGAVVMLERHILALEKLLESSKEIQQESRDEGMPIEDISLGPGISLDDMDEDEIRAMKGM